MSWLPYPRSLFSRLVLLLLFGLVLAEAITALVLTRDRGEAIQRVAGIHSAQRIAGIVKILDQMSALQRQEIVDALDGPNMRISLSIPPQGEQNQASPVSDGTLFRGVLHYYLDDDRLIYLSQVDGTTRQHFNSMNELPMRMGRGSGMHDMMQRHMAEAGLILPSEGANLIQVELRDGQWVSFGEQLPEEMTAWPLRVILALGLVLITLGLVAFLAVRWITSPLAYLADSARALGQDLQRPPLEEEGPEEVRSTLRAFNTMQAQIRKFVDERSRFLAAISHDLKTPITRLRLRSGLLEDTELQAKFERDLNDMEELVQGTLEFMRDETGNERKQALDINDLLETMQIDGEEAGAKITLTGRAQSVFYCHPVSLRRMINNLVDNALKYGGQADIQVEDSKEHLKISITDAGTGIPEPQIEQVFEPYTRLDNSRSKKTGGTGLGLTIAKNIAVAHGGTLTLRNRKAGGLQAIIMLPR
ncbi:ATP-binding protein [Sedimenticola selenatireducens]|uniref:sensor histidine kinase n=1 Tax=Sedimenticola selenatireducens TaxID=191960 RepID=UPI002AAC106F|nr:ATP-binding protein [Sedimenticola selenatireducens]